MAFSPNLPHNIFKYSYNLRFWKRFSSFQGVSCFSIVCIYILNCFYLNFTHFTDHLSMKVLYFIILAFYLVLIRPDNNKKDQNSFEKRNTILVNYDKNIFNFVIKKKDKTKKSYLFNEFQR
jgi:hypothetical protein